jgi:hypothetical protein
MSKDVFVDFSGTMKLDSRTHFTLVGLGQGLEETITAAEWANLAPENRAKYILTDFTDASRRADEFNISQIFFRIS